MVRRTGATPRAPTATVTSAATPSPSHAARVPDPSAATTHVSAADAANHAPPGALPVVHRDRGGHRNEKAGRRTQVGRRTERSAQPARVRREHDRCPPEVLDHRVPTGPQHGQRHRAREPVEPGRPQLEAGDEGDQEQHPREHAQVPLRRADPRIPPLAAEGGGQREQPDERAPRHHGHSREAPRRRPPQADQQQRAHRRHDGPLDRPEREPPTRVDGDDDEHRQRRRRPRQQL